MTTDRAAKVDDCLGHFEAVVCPHGWLLAARCMECDEIVQRFATCDEGCKVPE